MSLERGRLRALVNACDLDGICDWVDEVVTSAKASAVEEHIAASGADGLGGDTAVLAVEAFDRHYRLPGSRFFHELTVEEQRSWHKAVDYLVRATRAGAVSAYLTEVNSVCGPPPTTLHERISQAINATSSENGSNTPDFILAEYLVRCLGVFNATIKQRAEWYGRMDHPCAGGEPRDTPGSVNASQVRHLIRDELGRIVLERAGSTEKT